MNIKISFFLLAGIIVSSVMLSGCKEDDQLQHQEQIPTGCNGITEIEYLGQLYRVVEIGSQCWMAENLNAGIMINDDDDMTDNDTIEKYCYDDDPANCITYGGLYHWDEIMQYSNIEGAQGICPTGWHLPSDSEWKVLEGTVDSQYPVGSLEWNEYGFRGSDAGNILKSDSGWFGQGNGIDLYGFSALPAGCYSYNHLSKAIHFATSTEYDMWYYLLHGMSYEHMEVGRWALAKYYNCSVRCVKD